MSYQDDFKTLNKFMGTFFSDVIENEITIALENLDVEKLSPKTAPARLTAALLRRRKSALQVLVYKSICAYVREVALDKGNQPMDLFQKD